MSDKVEIDWSEDMSQTLAYSKPPTSEVNNALAQSLRESCVEANENYDYLKSKLGNSVMISKRKLEQVLALMQEHDGDQIEIFFEDNKPVFFEQRRSVNDSPLIQAVIAPKIKDNEIEEATDW